MKTNNENVASTSENSHKVLIDPTIPIEELLGSVTTFNNVEGSESFQLRTSARVFKKMKLDSAQAALPEKKVEPEKKEEVKSEVKKLQKPFWTTEDRNYFFEALNEYGKDFEAIHTYINTKLRKKGTAEPALKTREQIRHLYYRTWHKISKHLKFSEDVKKVVQELYGLINYGELRKKLTSVSEKTCIKLNELIYRGTLAIRVKGRTIRIRTPMCKALRRLNQLEENDDDIKLPTRVLVECMPKDMYTWMKVQEMSQNPRIRMLVPLQRRLSSLIYYLSQRWKQPEVIEHEKLINQCLQSNEVLFDGKVEPRKDPPLRLAPPKDIPIVIPSFNITEFFTTQSICLNAYEERIGAKQSGELLWLEGYPTFRNLIKISHANKRGIKRTRTESNSEKGTSPNNPKAGPSGLIDNNENCVTDTETTTNTNVNEVIDEAVNTILSLQQQETPEPVVTNETKEEVVEEDCTIPVKKEPSIANIRLGWTLPDCATLTAGDLYLMFGVDSKIVLEYSWDESKPAVAIKSEDETMADVNVKKEEFESTREEKPSVNDISSNRSNVTASLKQLLSVAKLHYRKNMIKCPCGHVCGSPTKNQSKVKIINKPIKNGIIHENKTFELQAQPNTMVTVYQQNSATTTANMVPILIQPEIKKFSPQSLFRRPNSPNCGLRAQINSIQRMMPRYCNRKGRPRTKQVVVERKLPLLANKGDRIVQMTIIPQEASVIASRPTTTITLDTSTSGNNMYSQVDLTSAKVLATHETQANGTFEIAQTQQPTTSNTHPQQPTTSNTHPQQPTTSNTQPPNNIAPDILDNATTLSRANSPTGISNLLDIALQNAGVNTHEEVNKELTSFEGLLSQNVHSTPPASPSRILKENDDQWINAEVADFSFSSFLGHLDSSPMKNTLAVTNIVNSEDTRMSLTHEVDAQLQSLLTETSADYIAKFADFAGLSDFKK